jgi:hypothetical protein
MYVSQSHKQKIIHFIVFLQVELCVKILSDIMELLFRKDIGPTVPDIKEIMLTILRTVIQTTIAMDRESPLVVSPYSLQNNGMNPLTMYLQIRYSCFVKVCLFF